MKKKLFTILTALFLFTSLSHSLTRVAAQEEEAIIYPASYQLNALDSQALAEFYEENMGMTILEEEDGYYRLGTSEELTLLEIFPTDIPRGETLSTGLYHTAFLFSEREYLGSALNHLFETQSPIEGFTYHGVSDAVYAADIEGNGIELYWDYPESEWPESENDGEVEMLNEPLDYVELMESATEEFTTLDERVKLGHFHLVSDDFEAAGEFYGQVLGLNTRSFVEGDSIFQASGNYHHHLANNNWFADQNLSHPEFTQQGLRATIWSTESEEFFNDVMTNLDALGVEYTQEGQRLSFLDTSGLGVIVELVNE